MKDSTEKRLAKILGDYDRRMSEEQEEREQEKSEDELFLEQFKELRRGTIRPVMEGIGNILREQGHEYRIEEREYSVDSQGRPQHPSIKMTVLRLDIPGSEYGGEPKPGVSFAATVRKKEIHGHHSAIVPGAGGSAGPSGKYTLDSLSGDAAERDILAGLEKIFSAVSRYSHKDE